MSNPILPDNGRRLILHLKECVQALTPHAHENPTVALDESNEGARRLCEAVEMILTHGIRIREFNGMVPLWGFLERLEILTPPCIPLRNTVGAVASMAALRSPIARARGWIRQIMNAGSLDESAMFMMAQSQLLRSFYYPGAILLNPEGGMALVAVLRSAKIVKFNFNIETDPHLNVVPAWMLKNIHQAMQAPAAAPTLTRSGSAGNVNANSSASSANGNGGGGGGVNLASKFDSFMRSFETSLDSMLVKVDAAADLAAKFINDQLEQPSAGTSNTSGGTGGSLISALASSASSASKAFTPTSAGRLVPFFGSPLKDLIMDERRTAHAYLNPLLGIPNQALRMINFLTARANTPDLFRRPVTLSALNILRRDVEEEREFAGTTEVAAVALLLMQWLNQLPEPLLGYEHYTAIIACMELEDPDHRIRNLALLVQEASWYAKPLLLKLVAMFHKCIQPEYAVQNSLNIIAVSVLSTPYLLRPFVPALHTSPLSYFQETEARERMQMAATATGSTTVEFLITHHGKILQRMREEYQQREASLKTKCARIVTLQETLAEGVDTMYVDYIDEQRQATIRELWELLALAERHILLPSHGSRDFSDAGSDCQESPQQEESAHKSDSSKSASVPIGDILSHVRWTHCGFGPAELPLKDFNVAYGWLSLQCLTGFLRRYHKQGAVIVQEYCQQRQPQQQCMLTQAVLQLTHFTAEALRLESVQPPPSTSSSTAGSVPGASANTAVLGHVKNFTPVQALARQPSWLLLTDENCFQDVFDMALLSFEDAWKAVSSQTSVTQGSAKHPMSNAQMLSQSFSKAFSMMQEIIHKGRPRTIEQMWECWLSHRLAEQERLATRKLASYAPSPTPPAQPSSTVGPSVVSSPATSAASIVGAQTVSGVKATASTSTSTSTTIPSVPSSPAHKGKALAEVVTEGAATVVSNVMAALAAAQAPNTSLPTPAPTQPAKSAAAPAEKSAALDVQWMKGEVSDTFSEAEWETEEGSAASDMAAIERLTTPVPSSTSAASTPARAPHIPAASTATPAKNSASTPPTPLSPSGSTASFSSAGDGSTTTAVTKTVSGVLTKVRGGSHILSPEQIQQLEETLPTTYQCYDWDLVYRLSMDGANVTTLVNKAKSNSTTLLVVQDTNGAVFGALITEQLKMGEKEKYYGNGTIAVWSFATGELKFYPWSFKNSYFLITSRDSIALGGGGHFAIYMDGDLNKGSSGPCLTFCSPCLASQDEFTCQSCELFTLSTSLLGL